MPSRNYRLPINCDPYLKDLSEDAKVKVSLCVCNGLDYLHSVRLAHRNLKPENILLFGDKTVAKISGFGISKVVQNVTMTTKTVISPKYTPPEFMISGKSLNSKSLSNLELERA